MPGICPAIRTPAEIPFWFNRPGFQQFGSAKCRFFGGAGSIVRITGNQSAIRDQASKFITIRSVHGSDLHITESNRTAPGIKGPPCNIR